MSDLNPLSQSFTIGSLLRFAFPTILTMVFMGLYTVADTIFAARFVDTNALSALNIVCPVINLTVGLGTMLAAGGSAIVARKMGEGEHVRAAQDFTLIIAAGFLLGMLTAVLGTVFIDKIVWGLGAGSLLFPYCREYLSVLLLFTPASILQVLFQNLIVTAGLSRNWHGPWRGRREWQTFCWITSSWPDCKWVLAGRHLGQVSVI